MRPVLLSALILAAPLMLSAFGCKPASRYSISPTPEKPSPTTNSEETGDQSLKPGLTWDDAKDRGPATAIRLQFVHEETNPTEWAKLEKFWSQPTIAQNVVGALGSGPLGLLTGPIIVGPDPQVLKIKVPRGLDDPTPFIPAANPPTLAKWELGRQLFFDKTWLSTKTNVSCAECHLPDKGFSEGLRPLDRFRTPTLVNVVFNKSQFWDGGATYLEEVVARKPEDERETDKPGPFRHTWGGAIDRLQKSTVFEKQFAKVFGTLPTQDNVGKALATYLRTLLAGDSLYDRALHAQAERKEKDLTAADFEKVLNDTAMKTLGESRPKKEVADDLFYGYKLFTDRVEGRKLLCATCHSGRQFTDGQFYNVGIPKEGSKHPGRFANVPIGLREREQVGAFKTPTLRGLLRSAPYFRDGGKADLQDAIVLHTSGFNNITEYLARQFRTGDHWISPARIVTLTPEELRALTLFLKSLNGEEVDAAVRTPPAP